jgi:DNA-directed RNA polymerase subunit D
VKGYLKKDDNAITISFEEGKYIFKLETDGSLEPFEVLTLACDILSGKADNIKNFVMNEEE